MSDDLWSAIELTVKLRDDWRTLLRLFSSRRAFELMWLGMVEAGMDEERAARLCRALHDDHEAGA